MCEEPKYSMRIHKCCTREQVLYSVFFDGLQLEDARDEFKNDIEIVTDAVKNNGLSLQYASNELRNNAQIVSHAISQNWHALEYAGNELKKRGKK